MLKKESLGIRIKIRNRRDMISFFLNDPIHSELEKNPGCIVITTI